MNSRQPLIAVPASHDPRVPSDYVKSGYRRALAAVGAVPVIIPPELPEEDTLHLLELCDGALITGGEDVDPACYGQAPSPACGAPSPARDRLDLLLIGRCLAVGKPLMGICRGLQVINVCRGGTLIQDIGSALASPVAHVQPEDYARLTHEARAVPGSDALARICGLDRLSVNSRHHQCVDRPGDGVEIVARCPADGVAEALVVRGHPFAFAVQWHPEWLVDDRPEQLRLFATFALAARGRFALEPGPGRADSR